MDPATTIPKQREDLALFVRVPVSEQILKHDVYRSQTGIPGGMGAFVGGQTATGLSQAGHDPEKELNRVRATGLEKLIPELGEKVRSDVPSLVSVYERQRLQIQIKELEALADDKEKIEQRQEKALSRIMDLDAQIKHNLEERDQILGQRAILLKQKEEVQREKEELSHVIQELREKKLKIIEQGQKGTSLEISALEKEIEANRKNRDELQKKRDELQKEREDLKDKKNQLKQGCKIFCDERKKIHEELLAALKQNREKTASLQKRLKEARIPLS